MSAKVTEENVSQLHDNGEAEENDIRRDDHLEVGFGIVSRDFERGSTRNDDIWMTRERERQEDRERRLRHEDELFDARMSERTKLDSLENRERERFTISRDDRDGLRFRDATQHSTAIASLESEIAAVGDEQQENVPDEEHPDSTAQK